MSENPVYPALMGENPKSSLTLLSVVRQWPIANNIAEHLPAGSLINLARSSVSLRQALHSFDIPASVEAPVTTEARAHTTTDAMKQDIRSCKVLQIGAHRTPYWEGLKRAAPFTCSSKTHTKGQKTKSCRYCSMPTCESCVVKHSFGKNEHTFKNRCRFMCKRCWDSGNVQKERRYSGASAATDRQSHRLEAEARQYCTCTSKDGWVCNDCKEKQNTDAKENGTKICFGQDCGTVLEEDKDRRKICLWCNKPVPRGRASIESRLAFDQKMIDAREREINSQLADLEEYESTRRRQMRMSRREMRGDAAVRDDPDADEQQFIRNLDIINYQRLHRLPPTGQEIYGSKHGRWKYQLRFLTDHMHRYIQHKDSARLKEVTSGVSPDNQSSKTNREVWIMKWVREGEENTRVARLSQGLEMDRDPVSDPQPEQTDNVDRTEEQIPDAEPDGQHLEQSTESGGEVESDDEFSILQDDEIAEGRKKTEAQAGADEPSSTPELPARQPMERPPEYGADTLVLESGDTVASD